jgi:hypothetical protein
MDKIIINEIDESKKIEKSIENIEYLKLILKNTIKNIRSKYRFSKFRGLISYDENINTFISRTCIFIFEKILDYLYYTEIQIQPKNSNNDSYIPNMKQLIKFVKDTFIKQGREFVSYILIVDKFISILNEEYIRFPQDIKDTKNTDSEIQMETENEINSYFNKNSTPFFNISLFSPILPKIILKPGLIPADRVASIPSWICLVVKALFMFFRIWSSMDSIP